MTNTNSRKKIIMNESCSKCSSSFDILRENYLRRKKKNIPLICDKCMKEYKKEKMSKSHIKFWENASIEDRKKHAEKSTEWYHSQDDNFKKQWATNSSNLWNSFSKEKKDEINKKKNWYANSTDEEKADFNRKKSENYHNQSDEYKEAWAQRSRDQNANYTLKQKEELNKKKREWYSNLTKEEKNKRAQDHSIWYHSLSEEIKQQRAENHKEYWRNLSEEQWLEFKQKVSNGLKSYVSNLSDEEKQKRSNQLSMQSKNYWDNASLLDRLLVQISVGFTNYNTYNNPDYKPDNEFNIEFENRISKLGLMFYREYPSIILYNEKDKELLDNKLYNYILYTKEINNEEIGYKKNWDYLIYIPYTNKKLYIDLDGDIHFTNFDFIDIINKFSTLQEVMQFYDDRRSHIICDKLIINKDNLDKSIYEIIKFMEL